MLPHAHRARRAKDHSGHLSATLAPCVPAEGPVRHAQMSQLCLRLRHMCYHLKDRGAAARRRIRACRRIGACTAMPLPMRFHANALRLNPGLSANVRGRLLCRYESASIQA